MADLSQGEGLGADNALTQKPSSLDTLISVFKPPELGIIDVCGLSHSLGLVASKLLQQPPTMALHHPHLWAVTLRLVPPTLNQGCSGMTEWRSVTRSLGFSLEDPAAVLEGHSKQPHRYPHQRNH